MKKLFGAVSRLVSGKNETGEQVGIISLLKEKTGKISFRRSFPIVILTTIVAPEIVSNGLTVEALIALGIAAATYVLPTILKVKE